MKKLAFGFILILFTIPAFAEITYYEDSDGNTWYFARDGINTEITESNIDYVINVYKTEFGSIIQELSGIADVDFIETMAKERVEWQIVKGYLYDNYGLVIYKLKYSPIQTFIDRIDENRWLVSVVDCSKTY